MTQRIYFEYKSSVFYREGRHYFKVEPDETPDTLVRNTDLIRELRFQRWEEGTSKKDMKLEDEVSR